MKKLLQWPIAWLLAVLLGLAGAQPGRASHVQGGQIRYTYLGPGTTAGTDRYSVTVTYFRDCSGGSLPNNLTLVARPGAGCAAAAFSFTLAAVGTPRVGTPYCTTMMPSMNICTNTSPNPNYQYQDFTANINLAPDPEWTLSVDDNARPATANLVGQRPFRFEAKLYSQFVPTGGGPAVTIRNTSPQYSSLDLPVPFVQVNQPSSISFAANEPEGDSLVYSLEAPLATCGVNNNYDPIPGTCLPTPTVPGCIFVCPPTGPGRSYSATMPIAVSYTTTACVGGTYTRTPNLTFVPQTGLLTFTPNRFVATPPDDGDNKYVVVCKISEYRAVPGQRRKMLVGSVRRDFLVTVVVGTNTSPNPPVTVLDSTTVGGTAINSPLRTRIEVSSCNFTQARVSFTDPDNLATPPANPLQQLNVRYTGATPLTTLVPPALGTATLTANNTPNPVLLLTFQPGPAFVGQTISLTYLVEDDACPIKGTQTRVIEIFVRDGRKVRSQVQVTTPGLPVTGTGSSQTVTICPGGAVDLNGTITAVDSVRQTVGNRVRSVAQTYDLLWYAPGGQGLPPVRLATNTRAFPITVRPTVTTRYTMFSNPRTGPYPVNAQGLNACGDSVSVLVRVLGPSVVTIAATDTVVCAGSAVTLRGSATRSDGAMGTHQFAWAGAGAAGSTTSQITVTPQTTTRYTLTANSSSGAGCEGRQSITIRVVPTARASFAITDSVSAVGGSQVGRLLPPITFSLINQSTLSNGVTPFRADTVRYTSQRVRTAGGEAVTSPEVTFAKGAAALAPVDLKLSESGYYTIRLRVGTVASGAVCSSPVASRTVVVPDFQVPNIITPNADGLNDSFVVVGSLVGSKLEIYNRWGRKVNEYASYQNQWSGEGQPDGVYYYNLTVPGGKVNKGWVEVRRGQ